MLPNLLTYPRRKVSTARTTKFVPPAKSVTLSNLQVQATKKNITCMATVTMAHIAKLFSSRIHISKGNLK